MTEHFDGGFRLREVRGQGTQLVTLNGNQMQPIDFNYVTDFVDDDNHWNNTNPEMDEVATDLHWTSEVTHDYYLAKHNRNSIDDNGMTIIEVAHLGNNFFNAQWTGGWMQFGDSDNGRPLTGLGIVAHEYTHGITQYTAGLIYQGESGALNESFSDILGVSVEFMVGKDSPEDIWDLADELYDGSSMRSLSNPNIKSDPDTYSGNYWKDTTPGAPDNGGDTRIVEYKTSGITY
jgi:Zn-dependent metalloprotease